MGRPSSSSSSSSSSACTRVGLLALILLLIGVVVFAVVFTSVSLQGKAGKLKETWRKKAFDDVARRINDEDDTDGGDNAAGSVTPPRRNLTPRKPASHQQQHHPEDPNDWFVPITHFSIDERRPRWSEPALLKNYVAQRPDRACDLLASNITIKKDPSIVLGQVSQARMPAWREKQLRPAPGAVSNKCTDAFVLMVSNHKYVDGALVMADTLWNTSSMLRAKEICIVMLTSEKLNKDSVNQLSLVFDFVKAMKTLGSFVPRSYYAPTFDKAYLWSLTEYRHVMFLDADHYVQDAAELEKLLVSGGSDATARRQHRHRQHRRHQQHQEDEYQQKQRPGDAEGDDGGGGDRDGGGTTTPANRLVAVGDHGYFQTGLMVIRPNMAIFVDLYLEFRYGAFGYNQWRARDGILIRNCFLKSVDGIGHPGGIHHFYGFFKPWFDVRRSRKITKDPIEFGGAMFRAWWARYVDLHRRLFTEMPHPSKEYGGRARKAHLKEQKRRGFKCSSSDADAESEIDPACFMWLQRYNAKEEYLLPLPGAVKSRWWDLRVPSLKFVSSHHHHHHHQHEPRENLNCNHICASAKLVCRDDAFQWSPLGNCERFKKLVFKETGVQCRECHEETDGTHLPIVVPPATCSIHTYQAQKFVPRCDPAVPPHPFGSGAFRFCPCVSRAQQNASGVVIM